MREGNNSARKYPDTDDNKTIYSDRIIPAKIVGY